MVSIPAWCPHCDTVFDPGIFDLGDGASVELLHNRTRCPNCRSGDALMLDGTFTAEDQVLAIIEIAEWSEEQLARFQAAAAWAAETIEDEPEAAIERIEAESPRVASVVRGVVTKYGRKAAAGLLMAVAAALLGSVTDRAVDEVWPQDQPPAVPSAPIVVVPPPVIVTVEAQPPADATPADTPTEDPQPPSPAAPPQSPDSTSSVPDPEPPATESPGR